jgi:hypothetical protein
MSTEIKVTASATDGSETTRAYKTLSRAQKFAWDRVGETPEIGIGQAVSADGIVTVTCEGCALRDLFPGADWSWMDQPPMPSMAEQQTQLAFAEGDRVLVDNDTSDPFTATFIRHSDNGKATVDVGDAETSDFIEVPLAWLQALVPTPGDDAGDDEELTGSRMSIALRKARARYTKVKCKEGTSAHCNDPVARALEDAEPEQVALAADRVLGEPDGTHLNKYSHLNNGQIRMNSGNKIRAAWKKADEAEQQRILDILMAI